MKFTWLMLFMGLVLFSCNKNELSEEEQLEEDIAEITKYLEVNDLKAEKTSSGLHYIIDQQGTGVKPNNDSQITIRYTGYFTDDNVFDKSSDVGATFGLKNLISGWQEGIPLFNEGGKGMLLIPSSLGYGAEGNQSVPPNSVLIFDIELMKVD